MTTTEKSHDTLLSRHAWQKLLLILILLIAFALRLYLAATTTFIWDEERDWIPIAERISIEPGNVYLPIHDGPHPSLPAYFIRVGSVLLGGRPIGFRLFSLLSGILTVVLVYQLGRQWFGSNQALLAATLLAFNEYHIAVSIFAIQKSYVFVFSLLAVYFFGRFLQKQKASYLYLAGGVTGLGYLCHETVILILPVFFFTILISSYRRWLRQKEPYISLLVFFLVISPDIYWNIFVQATENIGEVAALSDHLSRIGGFGFTRQPFLFYVREIVYIIYPLIGKKIWDNAEEYPSMNIIFGIILFGGVVLMTFMFLKSNIQLFNSSGPISRAKTISKPSKISNYFANRLMPIKQISNLNKASVVGLGMLVFFFWFVFSFFTLIRPGNPNGNLDPVVWFWIDLTLIPSVLLGGYFLSLLRGKWRSMVFAFIGIAIAYSAYGVLFSHLDMPQRSIAVQPEFVWPPNQEMVDVNVEFYFCAVCDQNPEIELEEIKIIHGDELPAAKVPATDFEGAELGTDDRKFRLRATLNQDGSPRFYSIAYRIIDDSGQEFVMQNIIRVLNKEVRPFPLRFWAEESLAQNTNCYTCSEPSDTFR